jgi:hypothetical protein
MIRARVARAALAFAFAASCTLACAATASWAPLLVPAMAQAINREFGIILDTRRAGDVLVSVNGRDMLDAAAPGTALREALDAPGGLREVVVRRDDLTLPIDVPAADPPPAASRPTGCGYVAIDGAVPRNTRAIHRAEIVSIDGIGTPVLSSPPRHRVDAGRHVLLVRERIDDHHFGSLAQSERERQLARRTSHAYKVLVVEVPPGKAVHVGARLTTTLPDIAAIRANRYWEPVVWNVVDAACP